MVRGSGVRTLKRGLLLLTALVGVGCGGADQAWSRVCETGVLRVGMDASFPPFETVDAEGNLAGFDVELAREIAARLGAAAGSDGGEVQVQFVANLPYDGLYDALTAGLVDAVISALYRDPARTADFAYSSPYFNAGQVLVVETGGEDVTGMADLAGRTLAVEFGSQGDVEARTWAGRLDRLVVVPCESAREALASVATAEADAALVDHLSALQWIGASGDVRMVGDPVTDEPYAVAVRRDSWQLLQEIESALAAMEADGTMDRLRRQWFQATP